jgi:hypothetical protein
MKNRILIIVAILASAFLFSCSKDSEVNPITDTNLKIFSISPIAITPPAEGGEYELKITGNESWVIDTTNFNTKSNNWITFDKLSGSGADIVKVTIAQSSSFVKKRKVTITVTGNTKTLKSQILQETLVLGEDEVLINGLVWSTKNVGEPGTFVSSPDEIGMLYQFNRKIGYPATPAEAPANWPSSYTNDGTDWTEENDPSPEGWRIPTTKEMAALWEIGATWVTPEQTGFSTPGMIVGITPDKAAMATKDNLKQIGGLFLPRSGWRNGSGVMDRTWLCAVRSGTSLDNISGNPSDSYKGGMSLGDSGGYRDIYGWGDGPKEYAGMIRPVKKIVLED